MHLQTVDFVIIIIMLVVMVGLGLAFSRRAGKSVDEFFVSGRSLPWWLAGVSMVASAFAIDTPLGITGLVAAHGIQGVWFAWSFILGGTGVLGAFIFASLLRRSRIITTAELVELRYSGDVASSLRFFKGIYFGVLSNCIIMGWVMKAVSVFVKEAFGWDPLIALAVMLALTLIYTAASGMWGVVATDFIQFWISLAGTILLAVFAMKYVGGVDGLVAGLTARFGEIKADSMLHFVPRFESAFFPIFLVFITLKWWSNPTEAVTQRIVSSRTPKDASLATFFFALVHLGLNYWPMILVALVSLVVYPELPSASAERGYVMLMVKLLPAGVLGIFLAAMLAAFMSTIDTHVNVGAAYMINDIYRRFLHKGASNRHYVFASRVATVLMLLIAVAIAFYLENVKTAWYWLSKLTAGYGFILVIRWFWWRINAWSEIAALFGSLAGSLLETFVLRRFYPELAFGYQFLFVCAFSSACWLSVTYLTKPADEERLRRFCELVKPYRFGWRPIAEKHPGIEWNPHFKKNVLQFFVGAAGIYSSCFALGSLLFKLYASAAILGCAGALSFAVILLTLRSSNNGTVDVRAA
ncbi:MAG: Na+:solute symporter [Proteobacteria bacterium]|nr:Na+:solute symporter [Pseudomonadota bacterium]